MKKINYNALIIPLVLIVILAANAFFIVDQRQQAIILEFGKPVEFKDGNEIVTAIKEPGLKFKMPFIQKVKYFDKRIMNFQATDKEVLDYEKKALTINAFAKYKIINPLTFYQKVSDINGIDKLLDRIFEASLRDAIGSVTLKELLTDARTTVMEKIRKDVGNKTKEFGISILDVRIIRSDLPKENSESIYKRMYTERGKEAREYRAQGDELATIIRSEAEKEVKVIIAEANKEGQIIRGEGEAVATKIFADAFSRDTEFFSFYRTMNAYKNSLAGKDTRFVLSPDSEFLKYLSSQSSRTK